MPGTTWPRASAILMALCFAVFTAEALALHACPMHDGALTQQQYGAAHTPAEHVGGGHGADAGHAPTSHATGHACSCLGACCGAAPVAPPRAVQALVVVVAALVPGTLPSGVFRYHPSAPEHARPPSLGPPALHID